MAVRRLSLFGLVVLAIVASACAAHQPRAHVAPLEPMGGPQFNYSPPLAVHPSCWDPRVGTNQDGVQYREWFDNSGSNIPTLFKITDQASVELVCFGLVRPGSRQFGPAIWAHKSATTEWVVTGTSYITVVNSDRTEGVVDDRPVRLEYVRAYGWYTRCPC